MNVFGLDKNLPQLTQSYQIWLLAMGVPQMYRGLNYLDSRVFSCDKPDTDEVKTPQLFFRSHDL